MIGMFEQNKIIVAPELNVKDLQAKGMELDTIIEYAVNKGFEKSDILFSTDFSSRNTVPGIMRSRSMTFFPAAKSISDS
jgi:hypothetical protein